MDSIERKNSFRKCKQLAVSALSAVIITSGVSACSDAEQPALPAVESHEAPAPEVPSISTEKMQNLAVNEQSAKKLAEAGEEIQDRWFLDTIADARSTGLSDAAALKLRSNVCRKISESWTLGNIISSVFAGYDLTEEQIGTIIGASITSRCPNNELSVNSRDVPQR